ncbi:unnamed protein product [Parnassius apollo]|uniref:(apollo) hypothetical protein n=1 Tax=Parnassius apollo TaxID=110799 RepID=A0A8S3XXT7_PARAO|nr:unnamed protein product [Parnassius apollo]
MPLTPKERQKLYRERLKEVNPEKFKLQQKQNAERTKRNRKRIAEYPLSDQEIIRKQWRERKKKSKKEPKPEVVPLERQILTQKRNYNRRVIYRLKNENTKLEEELKKYKKSLKKIRQRLNRSMEKNKKLLEIIEEKNQMIRSFEDRSSPIAKKDKALEQMTPVSKTCAYIDQNLPSIRPEERESVKKVLLEHNVIVGTIKDSYKSKNTQEKRLIKDFFYQK